MKVLKPTNVPARIWDTEFHDDGAKFTSTKVEIIGQPSEEEKYFEFLKTVLYFEEAANCNILNEYHLQNVKITADLANLTIKPVNITLFFILKCIK